VAPPTKEGKKNGSYDDFLIKMSFSFAPKSFLGLVVAG